MTTMQKKEKKGENKEIFFYFDPICPWCWNTSRWIKEVQKVEKLNVIWKTFSLFEKNKDIMSKEYLEHTKVTHRMLRMIEAARDKYGEEIVDELYTKLGILVHYKKATNEKDIESQITKYDKKYLLGSLDDSKWDKVILDSMQSAFDVVGDDVGTPIIIFNSLKKKLGYFGPVITEVPRGEDAIALWRNFENLCEYSHFYEVKRTRTEDAKIPDLKYI